LGGEPVLAGEPVLGGERVLAGEPVSDEESFLSSLGGDVPFFCDLSLVGDLSLNGKDCFFDGCIPFFGLSE